MIRAKLVEVLNQIDSIAQNIEFLGGAINALKEEGGKAKLIVKTKTGSYDYTVELNEKLAEKCLKAMVEDYNERLSALPKEVESYISEQRMEV